jgi:magnesium-transporting ATPase (P-type)
MGKLMTKAAATMTMIGDGNGAGSAAAQGPMGPAGATGPAGPAGSVTVNVDTTELAKLVHECGKYYSSLFASIHNTTEEKTKALNAEREAFFGAVESFRARLDQFEKDVAQCDPGEELHGISRRLLALEQWRAGAPSRSQETRETLVKLFQTALEAQKPPVVNINEDAVAVKAELTQYVNSVVGKKQAIALMAIFLLYVISTVVQVYNLISTYTLR